MLVAVAPVGGTCRALKTHAKTMGGSVKPDQRVFVDSSDRG